MKLHKKIAKFERKVRAQSTTEESTIDIVRSHVGKLDSRRFVILAVGLGATLIVLLVLTQSQIRKTDPSNPNLSNNLDPYSIHQLSSHKLGGKRKKRKKKVDPKWIELADRLCPNHQPDFGLTETIMNLARNELFSEEDNPGPCPTLDFGKFFFDETHGWSGVSRKSDGKNPNEIVSSLRFFSEGLEQVNSLWDEFLGGEGSQVALFKERKTLIPESTDDSISECLTFVIDEPIERFLAGYSEMEARINKYSPRYQASRRWPFGKHKMGTKDRFETLLKDLLSCPIQKGYPGILDPYPKQLEIHLLTSMTSALDMAAQHLNGEDNPNIHYLTSSQNLLETWPKFMLESCPNSFSEDIQTLLLGHPPTPINPPTQKWYDPNGARTSAFQAWQRGGTVTKTLCALMIMDYSCWRELPDGVPDICMDLYLQYVDQGLI